MGLAAGRVPEQTAIQNIIKEMEKDGSYETVKDEWDIT